MTAPLRDKPAPQETQDPDRSCRPLLTDLRPLPSDPSVRTIRVDGRAVGRLPVSDIEALDLRAGMAWTRSVAKAVQERFELNKARREAMRMLGRRSYAIAALEQRLIRKGHGPEIARRITVELASHGWLDDEATARDLAQQAAARRPAGRRLLEQRLRQWQFDPELAARIALEVEQEGDPFEQAAALARQRLDQMPEAPRAVAARRIAGLLYRRGFEADLVREVLRAVGLEIE